MKRKILYLNTILCLMLLSIAALGQATTTANQFRPETTKADPTADPVAWNLLKSTRDTRYYFVNNFSGFTADVIVNDNGKIAEGVVNYDVGGGADLQFKGEHDAKKPWVLQTVLNLIGHRRGGDFSKGDGRHPITFAEDDNSPAGRRVLLNDGMKSSYRININNGRVTEVDRTAGSDHFKISIVEELPAGEGRFLPRHFTVTYFDAATGAVKRTETFTDEYKQIGGVWFPASRRVLVAQDGDVITRVIEFRNPRIRFNNAVASQ
jgi:hypothetical protein